MSSPLHPREITRRFSEAPELSTLLRDQLSKALRKQLPEGQACFEIVGLPEELSRHRGFDVVIADQRLRMIVTYSRLDGGCRTLRCLRIDDITGEQCEVAPIEFDDWHSFRLDANSNQENLQDESSAWRILRHLMQASALPRDHFGGDTA